MCLVINKIDRLVLETRLTPAEAYERLKVRGQRSISSLMAMLVSARQHPSLQRAGLFSVAVYSPVS